MYWLYYLATATVKLNPSDVGVPTVAANQTTIQGVLNQVYIWAGIVAVLVIVIAGVRYTISQGEAEKVKVAKDMILYAVIGLGVIILAFTITQFVLFNVK